MSGSRCVLVTGGTGCIGAATVHALVQLGAERVVVASRSASPGLLRLWFGETLDPRIGLVRGDVGEPRDVERLVREADPTHVVHLGALQTPDRLCNCTASSCFSSFRWRQNQCWFSGRFLYFIAKLIVI